MNFFAEVWRGYRPYLVRITTDFLVTATLWAGLFSFKILTYLLPIGGWAGDFIVHVHSAGTLFSIVIFAWLSVNDIYHIHRTHQGTITCFA